MVLCREDDDMKSEKLMVIKSEQLFRRIIHDHESLRAFHRQLEDVVSLSTLSNWVKKRPRQKPWTALRKNIERIAEALNCDVEDIAEYPRPKPYWDSRFLLIVALGGTDEQMMELNVYGEEVALKERGTESQELRGNVLTADENKLTGHLQVLIGDIGAPDGDSVSKPTEMTFQANRDGDEIRGAMLARDRKGNILTGHFKGVRKGRSRYKPHRATHG